MEKSEKQKCLTHSLLESIVTETILLDKKNVTKNTKVHRKDEILLRNSHWRCSVKKVFSQR